MDGRVIVALVALMACVVLYALFRSKRVKAKIKTHFAGLELETSDEKSPGAVAEGITSRKGSVNVIDSTGRGATARQVDAHGDVNVAAKREHTDPKA